MMEQKTLTTPEAGAPFPRMLTIRQVASTGILPEHAIRTGVREGWIPHITTGSRVLINFDKLVKVLNEL